MRHTHLINYALYQIGWFACVLGGASHRPTTGFLVAMILVGVHLALSGERSLEVRLVVLATASRINDLEKVDQNSASWNPVISWLRRIERLKFAE